MNFRRLTILATWSVLGVLAFTPIDFQAQPSADVSNDSSGNGPVYVLPIREDIMPPLTYLVRRGVKEAITNEAACLILDMQTNGGRVDITEELISLINRFEGRTVTYVNDKAYSAGAFISVATQEIYMAPVSVIGAAAPILMSPGGGPGEMPNTMEVKMTSGISAMIRATAERHGHDPEVVEAMIDKSKELVRDGKVLSEKGQILTLTNTEAEALYGSPQKPLLSQGTFESMEDLLVHLGLDQARLVRIEPTGVEKVGTWINQLSSILLILGIVGIYLEFKTPGFGIPGIVGLVAFAIYFLGGYVAGLSGMEWAILFALGLILMIVELFFLPGTLVFGLLGAGLVLWSLLMGMVDMDPTLPVWQIPNASQLLDPIKVLTIALIGSAIIIAALISVLPQTPLFSSLVSASESGESSVQESTRRNQSMLGMEGITLSACVPGGKAQFGEKILDVVSDGGKIDQGSPIRIIHFSGNTAVVENVKQAL
ncbi:MAG: NfeD family protein, partial [Verrucomicrobiota bacterium]|nr:NfeD family protein [Verrucomicrobiota bacterium]